MVELRPSNAGRWAKCPASPHIEVTVPEVDGEDAEEGKAAHWLAAQVLGGHGIIEEYTDRQAPNGVVITGEIVEHTEFYINAIGDDVPYIIERSLPTGIPQVADGTPDAYRISEDSGHILDFKYGYGIVEAYDNLQLACYAVSLFARHEWQLTSVTVTIVQPRPYHVDGRVRSWEISRDVGWGLYNRLTAAAALAQDPNARMVTGSHCKHCRALFKCDAARVAGLNAVDVSMLPQAVELSQEEIAAELHTLRRAKELIAARWDALEGSAIAMIDNGKMLPGWSLDRAAGRERWLDDNSAATLQLLTGKQIMKEKPITPGQARKLGIDKTLVRQFSTTPTTGRKLVPKDGSAKAREIFK